MAQKKKFEDEGGVLTLQQALYHAVHDYPGGLPVVAAYFGMSKDTLQKKVSLTVDSHNPTLQDFERVLEFTKDARILSAICAPLGVAWSWLDDVPDAPADLDVLTRGTELIKASAAVIDELMTALEDSVVTDAELSRIKAKVYDVQREVVALRDTADQFKGE